MLWLVAAAAGVLAGADGAVAPPAGEASAEELLARTLEVIDRQSARIDELARENAQLREQNAQLVRANEGLRDLVGEQAARLAEANETIAVLQRMVFGRKSEKGRPEPPAGDGGRDAELAELDTSFVPTGRSPGGCGQVRQARGSTG